MNKRWVLLAGLLLIWVIGEVPVRPAYAADRLRGAAKPKLDRLRPVRQGLPGRPAREPGKPAGALKALPAQDLASPASKPGDPAAAETGLEETPPPDQNDPDRERILRLQEALTSIVHGPVLGRMRVGVRVIEAGTGRTFYRQKGAELMDPASNQKVLATTAAIMRLGADYRFHTELSGPLPDAEGVVAGDVVLRGSGDPSLEVAELEAMAADLASRGIRRVDGGVLSDQRRLGSREVSAEERSPLRISRSAVLVRVRPTAEGAAPLVVVRPSIEAIVVRNRAKTASKGRGRIRVTLSTGADGRMFLDVTGTIAARHPGMVMSRIPTNHRLYAAALMRQALIEAGIEVKGGARVGLARDAQGSAKDGKGQGSKDAGKDALLAVHRSEPLSVIIRNINKYSNNEWAERLLETVGAELYGGAATTDKGLKAMREALDELGLPREAYVPTNGSGLGHTNRLTADAMAELLQKLYTDPRWGPELMQSLSVGGVDGTIRNRFRSSPAAERVRAKTGTLNYKSCLSGYVGDGQEVLVFSILVEGYKNRRFGTGAVRAAQVNAVNAMMRYARGVLDAPPGEEPLPGTDFESGEDVLETDGEEGTPGAPAAPGTPAASTGKTAPAAPGGKAPAAPAPAMPSGAIKAQSPALRPARQVTAGAFRR
jgi:serine-type D-Ala-D-Ala carboxypeptidase/endopeptidase (penicillin-binding protein 4)